MSTTSQESKITGAGESKDSDQKHEEIIPTLKREHDSTDDFERVEPENLFASETSSSKKEEEEAVLVKEEEKKKQKEGATEQQGPRSQEDNRPAFSMDSRVVHAEQVPPRTERSLLDEGLEGLGEREEKAVPATPPPSADLEKYNSMADPFQQQPAGKNAASADQIDPRAATVAFVETERAAAAAIQAQNVAPANGAAAPGENTLLLDLSKSHDKDKVITSTKKNNDDDDDDDDNDEARMSAALDSSTKEVSSNLLDFDSFESKPSVPATKVEPEIVDLLSTSNHEILARGDENVTKNDRNLGMGDRSSDHEFVDVRTTAKKEQNDVNVKDTLVGGEPTTKRKEQTAEKTMNSEVKPDSKATSGRTSASSVPQNTGSKDTRYPGKSVEKIQEIEIAPKEIFTDMGLDAWFNPERLNPRVATLIYWRDPKKSGAVFGATLGLLLSLAYFSLISVLAYLSLLILIATVAFRIYKSVLQAIQKTSDGHPFKYILDLDLTLPNEKVHELADVAVAHVNATVSELRRLFLVEDIVDSLKFGVLLWCFTYIGSWFNGMTLIIIGVVALFTLPKVYETNKTQIDENLALVKGKIDEFTAKIKVAIPLVKKPEPTKED